MFGGFQSYKHHVALRHIRCVGIDQRMADMERTVAGVYLQSVRLYVLIITVREEMNLLPVVSQFAPVVAANGTKAYNSVSHVPILYLLFRGTKVLIFRESWGQSRAFLIEKHKIVLLLKK
jgi:hypothetical protein